jgi:hypothetical protein
MDTKRLLTGTVVGGIVAYVLGYLFWGVLLVNFFEGQMGSATGLTREAPILWAEVVGTLVLMMLVTLVIGWRGGASMMDGLKTGALVGFLVWLGADLIIYANFNFWTLTGTLTDSVVEIFRTGIAGAAIGAVVGGGSGGEAASTGEGASSGEATSFEG